MGFLEAEEVEFEDYEQFFQWLDSQVKMRGLGSGPKFKTFDIVDVPHYEIDESYRVDETVINKIPGIKKYHCMVPVGTDKLLFRRSTCVCEQCDKGSYKECGRDKIHGEWIDHCITKSKGKGEAAKLTVEDEYEDDDMEYDYEEDEYGDDEECSDDDEEDYTLLK